MTVKRHNKEGKIKNTILPSPESDPPESRQSLETEKNITIAKHLFYAVKLEKPKRIITKQRIQREFRAATAAFTALSRIETMLAAAISSGIQHSIRIELRPATTMYDLLKNMSSYIPLDESDELSAQIELDQTTFSPNVVHQLLRKNEKIGKAITIPINDFSAFVVKMIQQKQNRDAHIPAVVGTELKMYILGTTLEAQPTSLIFWIGGMPQRTTAQSASLYQKGLVAQPI